MSTGLGHVLGVATHLCKTAIERTILTTHLCLACVATLFDADTVRARGAWTIVPRDGW